MIAFFFLFSILLFIAQVAICVWAYRDALNKGRSQEFAILVLLGLFFFPILGLIVYLIIRNDNGSRSRF
ncbi:PLDc_N domain-containing protein [Cohnella sp. AR92]|nr:PLDc N-terminal domain-containing protein [Cohnella sp. AR92]RUS43597.1 PLDc_N domain-containing protein [Cohnella sp. AR92]